MPIAAAPLSLDQLRDIIVAGHPETRGGRFSLLTEGWDSVAVDVDDRLIFKFPREPRAEAALMMEARLLDVIRPAVAMPVPELTIHQTPLIYSRHAKLAGEHLLTEHYGRLSEGERQRLADKLGVFYAQLHAIDPAPLRAAGAAPIEAIATADAIAAGALPILPDHLRALAEQALAGWAALTPDPYGETYGFFDGHGWNMAFDHASATLNGVYDFADSGFGPLHEEFTYSSFVSADLTGRIVRRYETETGKQLDRERIHLTTGAHRLWELAQETGSPETHAIMIAAVEAWAASAR
ncbi:Phosphotransferase enzyme family protein [Devosia sp. LC5]|uniref:phosphotransferase family protein n=1 Tax=Devosia sp. LC5 TaxID=1502724 RepID=UPI0004E2DDE8|nr:aminoglycoside phosphotransferase family protein [Devosia sp. LC5]KFC67344.1 Phosphotransferase enzyme family protein [Devosia sp. LC5]